MCENKTKRCWDCGLNKELFEFYKNKRSKDGHDYQCKDCVKKSVKKYVINNVDKIKKYQKDYIENHKQEKEQYDEKYRQENKDKIKKYKTDNAEHIQQKNKEYYEKNTDEIKRKKKIYREKNKESINEYQRNYRKEKIKSDPIFKIKESTRGLIKTSFGRCGFKKFSKTAQILGCDFDFFFNYIMNHPSREPWMTMENYGKYNGEFGFGWDLDHIIAIASADTIEDVIRLNHYTNFQPLDSHINRDIKKDKLTY